MAMGMSPDEFWHGEPRLAGAYRRADRIRQERADERLWMQGRYVYDAMLAVSPVFNPLSKRREAYDYHEKPMTQKARDREADEQARLEERREAFMARFKRIANKQKQAQGVKQDG